MFYVFNNRHPCNYGEERDRRKLKEIRYTVIHICLTTEEPFILKS